MQFSRDTPLVGKCVSFPKNPIILTIYIYVFLDLGRRMLLDFISSVGVQKYTQTLQDSFRAWFDDLRLTMLDP